MDLFFGGVEGEIADVERGCVLELIFRRWRAGALFFTVVAVASALLVCVSICDIIWRVMDAGTFAVAYELGLSRRSTVLRIAGMVAVPGMPEDVFSECDCDSRS